jgi:hypothetical protein
VQQDSYFLCYDPAVIKKIFDEIRTDYMRPIGRFVVQSVRDLTTGAGRYCFDLC